MNESLQRSTTRSNILLVEDDAAIAMGLRDTLEFEGYLVKHVPTGAEAMAEIKNLVADLVILDVMLPDIHGFQLCAAIRKEYAHLPILMLTARSQEADKVRGFGVGADDYLTKPFSIAELVARVGALLRRANPSVSLTQPSSDEAGAFMVGAYTVDPISQQLVDAQGHRTMLSYYEVEVLRLLMDQHQKKQGEPVHRDVILKTIWGIESSPNNRTVDNLILRLRRKIEPDPETPQHILTIYGMGYKLVP